MLPRWLQPSCRSAAKMWPNGHIQGVDHLVALFHPFIQLVSRFGF